jgi:hypothetical protein
MNRILTILGAISLLTAPAFARSHHYSHSGRSHHAIQRSAVLTESFPAMRIAPMNHMPSAGELEGNTGGYEHPEGAGTTSGP